MIDRRDSFFDWRAGARRATVRLAVVVLGCQLALAQIQQLRPIGEVGGALLGMAAPNDYPLHAFIAQGASLVIVNFADPANPAIVGRVFIDAKIFDLAVSGQRAYLACGIRGMRIIDISDLTHPKEMPPLDTLDGGRYVLIQGDRLYFTSSDHPDQVDRLSVADISDPNSVNVVHTVLFPGVTEYQEYPGNLAVSGKTLYVAAAEEVRIFDVSGAPTQLGVFESDEFWVHGLVARGDVLYTCSGSDGTLSIADVSNPASPVEIGETTLSTGGATLAVIGDHAYVGSFSGVVTIDVSDPANPFEVGIDPVGDETIQLVKYAGLLYVVTYHGLHLWDMVNPESPVEVAAYSTPFIDASGVAVLGNFAYVTAKQAGLKIVDVSQHDAPIIVGGVDTPGEANHVALSGSRAFVADIQSGMRIYDVSEPTLPVLLGVYDPAADVGQIILGGPYAFFVGAGYTAANPGLFAVDVSDVSSPVLADYVDTGSFTTTQSFTIKGNYAYLAEETGLIVVDISDPSNLSVAATYPYPSTVYAVGISGNFAYITLGPSDNDLRVLNISNPLAATEVDSLPLITVAQGNIAFANSVAFVTTDPVLWLVDISNPSDLTAIAKYGDFQGLSTESSTIRTQHVSVGSSALVATLDMGLLVIPPRPPAPILNPVPPFINADTLVVSGTAVAGSFVTVGGGEAPVFQQLAPGATAFSIVTSLRQTSVHTISVTTLNEFGLVSLPAIRTIVEGAAFPAVVTAVTALALTPSPAGPVALNDSLAFTCVATFSNAAQANVTQFVQWEDTANGEVITPGGLYLNSKAGVAQVRAFVAGVFSNVVPVGDGP